MLTITDSKSSRFAMDPISELVGPWEGASHWFHTKRGKE